MTRNERTSIIYNYALQRVKYTSIKRNFDGFCRVGSDVYAVECGEVYSDFWGVKIFDDGEFQISWLELDGGATVLVAKRVKTIQEVYKFIDEQ